MGATYCTDVAEFGMEDSYTSNFTPFRGAVAEKMLCSFTAWRYAVTFRSSSKMAKHRIMQTVACSSTGRCTL